VHSILTTDGYKFSMAQAGFPLRRETFYLSFRKGGWQYVPYDLEAAVRNLLPGGELDAEKAFLAEHGYELSAAMMRAASLEVEVKAAPARTWVYEREPIVTVSGPSFLVSWLEPLVLRLFFPIQFATAVHDGNYPPGMFRASCEADAETMRKVLAAVGGSATAFDDEITVEPDAYREGAAAQGRMLLDIVKDPTRVFEVGMRAATSEEQHRIALEALRELGILATSNVALARELGMKPVGTMGHEHIQRWGNDLDAYRAMRDMRRGAPSYLLDTFDTITSGIPAAIRAMREREHACSIRYDSGDKFGQYIYAHGEFQRNGLEPMHIIEDGLTAEITAKFERLRDHTGLAPEKQVYGYGGFLVSQHWSNPFTRDRVAAVYKLTETSGEPRMKFGNEAGLGKVSVPGRPVAWRRLRGDGPLSIIGQEGERVPEDFVALNGNPDALAQLRVCNVRCAGEQPYLLSPETERLVQQFSRSK
jgi:nicotinic acid phosphoribosyltransferase